jgi:SAM-dependent methyltransferase
MKISNCRVCGSEKLVKTLDLGMQPWCNDFVLKDELKTVEKYPLSTVFCSNCSTFQVQYTVPKEIMFKDHTYLSGSNASMPRHFQKIADRVCSNYVPDAKFVVDIGSNDGTLLKAYKNKGLDTLGVEPCTNVANIAIEDGIPTKKSFFNYDVAQEIYEDMGHANIISAANVFYHVEELHDIVKGIKFLLDKNGVFVVQGTYLPNLIERNEFDIIYHEHLLYYRIENLNYLLNMHDLEVFDVDFEEVHGGSMIAYIGHLSHRKISNKVVKQIQYEKSLGYDTITPYKNFSKRVADVKTSLNKLLNQLINEGKTVYAYGAPAKGTVLLNYCGIDSNLIPVAVEVNKAKIGRYFPGVNIEVVDESKVEEPDYYLLLSWNFLDVFKKSKQFIEGKRKFIVPVPTPEIVSN